MEWQQILDTFARMPAEEQQSWLRNAAGLIILMLSLLWLERWYFKRSGRGSSWLAVRLTSLLGAILTLTVVIAPARAISGPEALGVFILMLYTGAPLIWFGSHLFAGRRTTPPLSQTESLALGLTGLLIFSIPGIAYFAAEGPLYAAARKIGERRDIPLNNPPLRHTVLPVQRYTLSDVGLIYTQSLIADPNTRLARVELRLGGTWTQDSSAAHPVYCTNGNDVHLMWSAKEAPPYLRLHWVHGNGSTVQSEFTPSVAFDGAPPPTDFSIGFRTDGVDPIAPIPRERAYLILAKNGLNPYTQMLGKPPGAGEVRSTDCVLSGFKRVAPNDDWQVLSMGILFYSPTGGQTLHALIHKPS